MTIKPADKGGESVIMDTSLYVSEISRQLSDEAVYEVTPMDPKHRLMRTIQDLVDGSVQSDLIDFDLRNFLLVNNPITPVLYCLPKIHKSLTQPPGRPIVSGHGSIFNPLAIFLDKLLQNYARMARSYIRDTPDFLRKLSNVSTPGNCILVSFDVRNLYTSINHNRGIECIRYALVNSDLSNECITFLLTLLEIVLKENYFLFENTFYRQLSGDRHGVEFSADLC